MFSRFIVFIPQHETGPDQSVADLSQGIPSFQHHLSKEGELMKIMEVLLFLLV